MSATWSTWSPSSAAALDSGMAGSLPHHQVFRPVFVATDLAAGGFYQPAGRREIDLVQTEIALAENRLPDMALQLRPGSLLWKLALRHEHRDLGSGIGLVDRRAKASRCARWCSFRRAPEPTLGSGRG